MADLTNILTQHSPASVVDAWYEQQYQQRGWLGLSQCGHKCTRWLWYCHRATPFKPPEGRILRLFQLGNILEDQIVIDLKSAGYSIRDVQKEVSFEWDDVTLKGHIDGIITGLLESSQPHLLEIKTSSNKRFMALKNHGYEAWDVKYKFQIHAYMLALKLNRCLAVVYNKDTSELYTERIKLDKEHIVGALQRCFVAIMAENMPERECKRKDYFEAKWCQYYDVCWRSVDKKIKRLYVPAVNPLDSSMEI